MQSTRGGVKIRLATDRTSIIESNRDTYIRPSLSLRGRRELAECPSPWPGP